jgi:hypothetical protein
MAMDDSYLPQLYLLHEKATKIFLIELSNTVSDRLELTNTFETCFTSAFWANVSLVAK